MCIRDRPICEALKLLGSHERNVIEMDRSKTEKEAKSGKKIYKADDAISHIEVNIENF